MKLSTPQSDQLPALASSNANLAGKAWFCHQSYTTEPPRAPHYFLRPQVGPQIGSEEFRRRMRVVGEALAAARVRAVYLVHSSFAALDSAGILAALARRYREARSSIGRLTAQMFDTEVHDAGNYTAHYAELLELGIDRSGGQLPVRLVSWSSENHHLGRADAAVRLIDELAALELSAGERVLLWGHGHAGNVFALMSQLLASDAAALEQFFAAAAVYYRWPMTGLVDIPVWRRVRHLLVDDRQRMAGRPCDWVTFGTPVRYGWKLRDGDHLLHFIHHRPVDNRPAHLALFPARIDDVLQGTGGDYVQQVAIAGTDTAPSPMVWRSWLANRRLGRLLQTRDVETELANRLKTGPRVPDCGTSLLVDYGAPAATPAEHLAGHAVYTQPDWLLFHAERAVRHLYGPTVAGRQVA